jgi:hypothetical protein
MLCWQSQSDVLRTSWGRLQVTDFLGLLAGRKCSVMDGEVLSSELVEQLCLSNCGRATFDRDAQHVYKIKFCKKG